MFQVLKKATVLMHGNSLHATVRMGVLRFKVYIFISPTFQGHLMINSESTFLSWPCINSLPVFWMSLLHSRIIMFPFMKYSMSLHRPIIWTGLKYLNPMLLSVDMTVHFFFNAWMEYREKIQMEDNEIDSLMQWLQ